MKHRIVTIGMSAALLASTVSPALAAVVVTTNQPDNGFYEGPSPEWATLHSTSTLGTAVHRQYHRDGAAALLTWLSDHRPERGTIAYEDIRRIFYQERNMMHRQFHTLPVSLDGLSQLDPSTNNTPAPAPRPSPTVSTVAMVDLVPVSHTYEGRPSRRSIIASVDEQNRLREVARQ
ncbi:hypothetical protein A2881_03720 [Candidatus Peribacteria bacterium RIFCSPHIGHO2_01_FULL_55_13]|nr:MAG: hypothetical protein A2881_03720 [Candidatus Peribacteria bacterium RIFCSPHIGHO2_01_FULL_55_13]OGJ64996.1 MAG: hypothetical protein A3F36_00070 [Candidatus Peribacteria bacterium RIFCSPHIGHO2_12_FULL_55_11]